MTKPFNISRTVVWKAYQKVKANGGAAGVDRESIQAFDKNLKGNLYKLCVECHDIVDGKMCHHIVDKVL